MPTKTRSNQPTKSSKHILVVEDEQTLCEAMRRALTMSGYSVQTAANGQEGLVIALASHPDLILLDHIMPVMDGVGMLEALRDDEWGLHANVIMTTNVTDPSTLNLARDQNVTSFVAKSDVNLTDLVNQVDAVFRTDLTELKKPATPSVNS